MTNQDHSVDMIADSIRAVLRPEARDAPESGIVEVMNYGRQRPGLIPLWAGEGDLATPAFICDAATAGLAAGETFYTWQRGIPDLREALSRYHTALYGHSLPAERFFVTASGMQAVQIAVRMVAGPGDDVLVPTPAWPNFAAAIGVSGARVTQVPMRFDPAGWMLDPVMLDEAATASTRAICINSPANPTGWTATSEELAAILDLARRRGWWIIADEIYGRFVLDGSVRAPSFHDVMEPDDKILFVQTFSKNWAMTGWRVGWIEAPAELGQTIENLIQYSTSGVAAFLQRAGIAAIEHGEAFIAHQVARARRNRDLLVDALKPFNHVRVADTPGAFYLFFAIEGAGDTRALAKRLVDEAGLGLAPGTAFGTGGEAFMRLCFARKTEDIEEVARRLVAWLRT